MMFWIVFAVILTALIILFWILRARQTSISNETKRNRHFRNLAGEFGFQFVTDGYFVQLEGLRKDLRVIIYPHNFEGPGLITLIYLETKVPAENRNWIEPNLSLGRALVEWKRHVPFNYEVTGIKLPARRIQEALKRIRDLYPYAAVTLPWRFSYSPLLQKSLGTWKNYAVFIAMDAGKKPAKEQIERALNDAESLAAATQSEIFSDSTG